MDSNEKENVWGEVVTQVIADILCESGLNVLEVDDDIIALEGEWYSPHVSNRLAAEGIENEERAGLITVTSKNRPATILGSVSGGVTFLQVALVEQSGMR
tara:strand:+ start:5490 stop:5789 length:300 start_codon:yes stop_codon:yes gene_type:complete